MGDWGGAQWLIVFFLLCRTTLGAARAYGMITIREDNQTPWWRYWSSRIRDGLLVVVLVWGGFF